jgi:transposase InsO family protein
MSVDLFNARAKPQWRLISGARGRAEMPTSARPNSFQADTLFFPIRGRNRAIFVAIELTSRWAYARLYRGGAPTAAESAIFLDDLARIHPVDFVTFDPGSEFVGRPVKRWCEEHLVALSYADAGDVRTKGTVEAFNRTLRLLLTRYAELVSPRIDQDALDEVINQYNAHKHSKTRLKPVETTESDLLRIRADAAARADPYRELLARFPPGTRVRVWLGVNPAWGTKKRAEWIAYHKTGVRWTREVFTVAGQSGYKLLLEEATGRWSPRDLLPVRSHVNAAEDEEVRADRVAEEESARGKLTRGLRREELDELARRVDAGEEVRAAPPRKTGRVRKARDGSVALAARPRRRRAEIRVAGRQQIEAVTGHRGYGASFELRVRKDGEARAKWRRADEWMTDGYVAVPAWRYIEEMGLQEASGI